MSSATTTPTDHRRKPESSDQSVEGRSPKRPKSECGSKMPQKESHEPSVCQQQVTESSTVDESEGFASCPKHPHSRWPIPSDQSDTYAFSATECPRCQQENAWVLIESMEQLTLQEDDTQITLEELWNVIQQTSEALEIEGEGDSWCLLEAEEADVELTPIKALGRLANALAQLNIRSVQDKGILESTADKPPPASKDEAAAEAAISNLQPTIEHLASSIIKWMNKATTSDKRSAQDEEILFLSCRALSNLAYPKRHGQYRFADEEEGVRDRPSIDLNSANSSSALAANAILRLGGVGILCRLLESPDDWTARVHEKALSAMVNLTISQSAGTVILEADGIQRIVNLLSLDIYQGNITIQEFGLSCLSQLLILSNQRQPSSEDEMAHQQHQQMLMQRFHLIGNLVIKTMNAHSGVVNIQARACAVIISLFDKLPLEVELWKEQQEATQHTNQLLGETVSTMIRLVIQTLQCHSADSTACHCAIVALQNLSGFEMPPQQSGLICSSFFLLNDAAKRSLNDLRNEEKSHVINIRPVHELPIVQLQHSIFALANLSLDLIEIAPSEENGQFLALIETCAQTLAFLLKCPNHIVLKVTGRNFCRIQDACLAALSRLASLAQNRSAIVSAIDGTCVDICINTISRSMHHLGVAKNGVALLGNLSATENSQTAKILEWKGMETILQAMQTHDRDEELQIFSIGALSNLLGERRAQLMLLESFRTQGSLNNQDIQGYKIIFGTMSQHSSNAHIQIRGCGCLLKMSGVGEDGMNERICQEIVMHARNSAQTHPQNTQVVCQTYKLWAQICKLSDGRQAIERCPGIIINALVRVAGENSAEANTAALMLVNASLSTKVRQIILDQGGLSKLVRAIKTHAFNGGESSSESTLLYVAIALRTLRQAPKWDEQIVDGSSGLLKELERCLVSYLQSSDTKQENTKKAIANLLMLLSDFAATKRTPPWSPSLSLVECVANILLNNNLAPSKTSDSIMQPGLKFIASLPVNSNIDIKDLQKAGVVSCILRCRLSVDCWHPLCCAMKNYARDLSCLKELESGQVVAKFLALLQMIRSSNEAVKIVLEATTSVFKKAKEFDIALFQKMKNDYCEANGEDIIRDVTDRGYLVPSITPSAKVLLDLLQEEA